jgi:hypothetical protein
MKELFELEWMGEAAEHHFRKARPGILDLPWGTLKTDDYDPEVVVAARSTWTRSSLTEYRAIAGFTEILRAATEAKVPLDIIGMASTFVADEVVHVELASRMAMELGGGTGLETDLDHLFMRADPKLTAFERANEMVLRVSCIAEAYSGKMAVKAYEGTAHPLTRAVLERINADESLHYRLGGIYFDWAKERLTDEERTRLAAIALECIKPYSLALPKPVDPTTPGRRKATIDQIRDIGWVEARLYAGCVRDAIYKGIVDPLASYGIEVDRAALEPLFGPPSTATEQGGRRGSRDPIVA